MGSWVASTTNGVGSLWVMPDGNLLFFHGLAEPLGSSEEHGDLVSEDVGEQGSRTEFEIDDGRTCRSP